MPWEHPLPPETDIIAIHVALLPTSPEGDILCFGDWTDPETGEPGAIPFTHSRLYHIGLLSDPSKTVEPTKNMPDTNAFCGGQAFLADGRLLVAGGTVGWPKHDEGIHAEHYDGERACWIYLPSEKRWVRVKDLNFQPGSNSKGGGRWYPTLVTLANGEVFAVAGHPDISDDYNGRHNNNTPERYSPTTNVWTLMTADITAPNGLPTDSFPRYHLLPNGLLFSDTAGKGDSKRILDPFAGVWTGPDVNGLPSYYSRGSSATSVLLPLLPPSYRPRVLACNSGDDTAFRIDVIYDNDDDSLSWVATADRQGSAAGRDRENGCAVLLPTGQVFLSGGWPRDTDANIDTAVRTPELYTPGIDWNTGKFSEPEEWATIEEEADFGRGYHSVALLLPDGRVWVAGSTSDLVASEQRAEIYRPDYFDDPNRPQITASPSNVRYEQPFQVQTLQANAIQRVALLRCGSVTHGFDSDQRYVGLQFNQIQAGVLQVCAPPNGNIAPPGYYMLWIVDDQDRPCQLARFIRVEKSSITSELELIKSYEDLLRSFEQLLAKQPCQDADLLKSFEGLLHSFETLLHDRQGKQGFLEKELLQSFECLLYSFEDLLHRFVGLGPKPLPDYCLPKNGPEGLPDLIPVAPFPPPPLSALDTLPQNFCTEPEGGVPPSRVVRVIVRNQGTAAAGPSVTRVEFPNVGVALTQPTPAPLGPTEEAVLDFDIPTGCYVGQACSFRITVDAEDDVVESDEGNNTVLSHCPAPAP